MNPKRVLRFIEHIGIYSIRGKRPISFKGLFVLNEATSSSLRRRNE